MEQLCAECETIDEFLVTLQLRANVFSDKRLPPGVQRQVTIGDQLTFPPISDLGAGTLPQRHSSLPKSFKY